MIVVIIVIVITNIATIVVIPMMIMIRRRPGLALNALNAVFQNCSNILLKDSYIATDFIIIIVKAGRAGRAAASSSRCGDLLLRLADSLYEEFARLAETWLAQNSLNYIIRIAEIMLK